MWDKRHINKLQAVALSPKRGGERESWGASESGGDGPNCLHTTFRRDATVLATLSSPHHPLFVSTSLTLCHAVIAVEQWNMLYEICIHNTQIYELDTEQKSRLTLKILNRFYLEMRFIGNGFFLIENNVSV